MARYESSGREAKGGRDRRGPSDRGRSSSGRFNKGSGDRRSGSGGSRDRRNGSRGTRFSRDARLTKTKVTCSSCGIECEVPFKPMSSKPVFCDACYSKSGPKPNKDFEIINQKLDKIMKALKID